MERERHGDGKTTHGVGPRGVSSKEGPGCTHACRKVDECYRTKWAEPNIGRIYMQLLTQNKPFRDSKFIVFRDVLALEKCSEMAGGK